MLLPPMTDYHEHIKTYRRPALPETFNFAEVIDGYAQDSDRMALIWTNSEGEERRFTYKQISEESQRIANTLKAQGVTRGDRVIVMLPRIPEWQMTMLAIFRLGAVAIPCITMLQQKYLEYRINLVTPKAVVTVRGETEKFSGLLGDDVARFSVGYGDGTPAEGWQDFAAEVAQA
ncbi:MAG: AMP-binding protein, partial [Parasphingorhabdus sp.]|uniref:AMP-binding protein n=1 Tax=Parasphingorhabdus sp. TaxID=2709688 RepID=UPI0032984B4D